MQRLSIGLVIVAITTLVPVLGMAANQEVAEQIATNLRGSGQLQDYKIGVKYQDGTAWLRGQISSKEQLNAVLNVVFQTPGVTRVVNNMTVKSDKTASNLLAGQPAGTLRQPLRQLDTTSSPEQFRPAASSLRTTQSKCGGCPTQVARRLDRVVVRAAAELLRPFGSAEHVPTSFTPTPAVPVAAVTMKDEAEKVYRQRPRLASPRSMTGRRQQPVPVAYTQAAPNAAGQPVSGRPVPAYVAQAGCGPQVRRDQPHLPNYAWPGYAAYPNYAALTYPKQYSPTAWPYIGPFYPYPQVPLGWRKVTLEWDDGWWMLDFKD